MLPILLACAPTTDAPAPDAETETEVMPSPYVPPPRLDDGEGVLLTPEEVRVAVETWVPYLAGADPTPLFDAYWRATESFVPGCPISQDVYEHPGTYAVAFFDYGCQSGNVAFGGYGTSAITDYSSEVEESWYRDLYMGGYMVNDAADRLDINGYIGDYLYRYRRYVSWSRYIQGDVSMDGADADGTWINDDLGLYLGINAYYQPPDYAWMSFGGGVSRLEGPVVALSIPLLTHGTLAAGVLCELEPSGTIYLRDAEGLWVALTFDAPDATEPHRPADACDGCGTLTALQDDAVLGQVCPDLSVLLDGSLAPEDK